MSYILDALRKADAERQLGAVPSLHAQPVPVPDEDRGEADDRPSSRRARAPGAPVWQWAAVAVAAAAVLLAGWALWTQPPRAPAGAAPVPVAATPMVVAPVAPPPATSMPATGPDAAPAGDPTTPATRPATPPTSQRPASAAVSVASPPPRAVSRPGTDASVNRPATARPAGGSSRAEATRPAESSTGAADAAVPVRLPAFGDLPPDVKRGLPALVIGGSVYSADPASRMLVINGQVVREGDPLGPDTVLEKIQPKQAIVRVRGQRATLSW